MNELRLPGSTPRSPPVVSKPLFELPVSTDLKDRIEAFLHTSIHSSHPVKEPRVLVDGDVQGEEDGKGPSVVMSLFSI
ncbi:hypothetical protein GMRT_fx007 [Giardia muris]|uniref:Uncharacterized protein n=1 Tax=Giardia muris TaxID=5742 RepID=A0A4Z1T099_GIAMU|nr:hypothetical protein GMRT_fx007 [Giardia muris]|eukprot:TNJ26337.1 hypothetical protein GMRT_fx007 [Giardia muris]